jgi:hypothetical protein
MQFGVEFETHITISPDGAARIEALQRWAASEGMHCLHIILEQGESPSQPMLTRHDRGEFSAELQKAFELSRSLEADGFQVLRVKIEASPDSRGVPQADTEAGNQSTGQYFEHHIKLLLGKDEEMLRLTELASRHAAHLSRNALRLRGDGLTERFITQRCAGVGRQEARRRLEALLHAISVAGHTVLKIEEEYVVYDNHLSLDAGWIG